VDFIVTSFYDSILAYATTIKAAYHLGENVSDGRLIANAMKNVTIASPLGYNIRLDADADRIRAFSIKQLSQETGKFEVSRHCSVSL
jgi:hypothetical protein